MKSNELSLNPLSVEAGVPQSVPVGFTRAAVGLMIVALLGGCGTGAYQGFSYSPYGNEPDPNHPGAVVINPVGDAEIRTVNGKPVIVGGSYVAHCDRKLRFGSDCWKAEMRAVDRMRESRQNYKVIRGRPGQQYILEVGSFKKVSEENVSLMTESSKGTLRVTFAPPEPGWYTVWTLDYIDHRLSGDKRFHVIVTKGPPHGAARSHAEWERQQVVLAASSERLVGMSLPHARRLLWSK